MVGGDTDALLLVAEVGITISPVGSIDGTILSVAGSEYVPCDLLPLVVVVVVAVVGGSLLIGRADKAVVIVVGIAPIDKDRIYEVIPVAAGEGSFFVVYADDEADEETPASVPNDEGSVSIFVPRSATIAVRDDGVATVGAVTISEDEVREAYLVVSKDDETGSISVPIVGSATVSEDEVREAFLVVSEDDEGSVSIFVPISATIPEDKVREAYLVDDEADKETGPVFVSIFVPISAVSEDEVREAATIPEDGVGEAMGHDDEEFISSATAGRISLSRADFPACVIIRFA